MGLNLPITYLGTYIMTKVPITCKPYGMTDSLKEFLEKGPLEISDIQTYFPIMDDFFRFRDSMDKIGTKFAFNSKYLVREVAYQDNVCRHPSKQCYQGVIRNNNIKSQTDRRSVFFKVAPILDPSRYMMNRYYPKSGYLDLPYPDTRKASKGRKINNKFNSAYTDSFCNFLTSKLVEKKMCPTFPLYYGSFNGISKCFRYDISEEYPSYKNLKWFVESMTERKLFKIKKSIMKDDSFQLEEIEDTGFSSIISLGSEGQLGEEAKLLQQTTLDELLQDELDLVGESDLIGVTGETIYIKNKKKQSNSKSIPPHSALKQKLANPEFNNLLENLDIPEQDMHKDDDIEEEIFAELPNFPVQITCIESLEGTLESILEKDVETIAVVDEAIDQLEGEESDELLFSECESGSGSDNGQDSGDSDSEQHSLGEEDGEEDDGEDDGDHDDEDDEESEENQDDDDEEDSEEDYSEDLSEMDEEAFKGMFFLLWKRTTVIEKMEKKWTAFLYQICFGLAVAQKQFNFTHNDLHSNNIMYQPTDQSYLYYRFQDHFYRVPTYGYILKIIDFGRSIYTINNTKYFNDVFEFQNEAGEQYSHPSEYYRWDKKVHPNPSFDLSRLAVSVLEDLYPGAPSEKENAKTMCKEGQKETVSVLFNLLFSWLVDRYGRLVIRYDNFDLYKIIARRMDSAVPSEQLSKDIFKDFRFARSEIPATQWVYMY